MAVFCSSFPAMLLWYFLNDLEMVAVVPIITGITLSVTFHVCYISIVRWWWWLLLLLMFLYFSISITGHVAVNTAH